MQDLYHQPYHLGLTEPLGSTYVNPPKKTTRDSKIRAWVFRFRDVEVERLVFLGQVRACIEKFFSL